MCPSVSVELQETSYCTEINRNLQIEAGRAVLGNCADDSRSVNVPTAGLRSARQSRPQARFILLARINWVATATVSFSEPSRAVVFRRMSPTCIAHLCVYRKP